jgi:hypothetical protein
MKVENNTINVLINCRDLPSSVCVLSSDVDVVLVDDTDVNDVCSVSVLVNSSSVPYEVVVTIDVPSVVEPETSVIMFVSLSVDETVLVTG